MKFGTKAQTLQLLQNQLQNVCIAPLHFFSVEEWNSQQSEIINSLQTRFAAEVVIVRSSALNEDCADQSLAGAYTSVPHIKADNTAELVEAINRVIQSYRPPAPGDQVLVQTQISKISMSGVMFTRDLDSMAPYYVINYDLSGAHDSVTSGEGSKLKTHIHFRRASDAPSDPRLARLVDCAKSLEALFKNDYLDIEFAFDHQDQLFLLQVRPVVRAGKSALVDDATMEHYLLKIFKKIKKLNGPHPGLHGKRAIYSVMTDWNPAEMIGIRPRALALSLYKELITDHSWAYQRHKYGYNDLRSFPLLISFLGLPYIDVRASFNSFIPATLDQKIGAKLVDYYIERLAKVPSDHDKVEFNIVFSCYYLNLPERIGSLRQHGFNDLELDRIKFSLLNLTNNIISPDGPFRADLEKVEHLKVRFDEILNSSLSTTDKIYWLIEDCKRYGTLPFAGLARAGFIAVQLLRSFVDAEILSKEEMQQFMASLNTVASGLAEDTHALEGGEIELSQFLKKYGHLRPGTYDILSPSYEQAPHLYFTEQKSAAPSPGAPRTQFCFSPKQLDQLSEKLRENGISADTTQVLTFIKAAIEGRELGKFLFTRHLSQILKLVGELGERYGFSADQISHLNISTIIELYSNLTHEDLPQALGANIKLGQRLSQVSQCVKLPQLITNEADVYSFALSDVEPNYVTLARVTEVIVLEEALPTVDLSGKIVLIKSADPGYDWVFSRKIGGLVTMYGGANSHMAIRCAELKIPAVIGCGELNFESWSKARVLDLDCANKRVRVVS